MGGTNTKQGSALMIHATIIAMTVLGCGDQAVKCEPITDTKKTWESIAECDAEIPKILRASTDAPYPVIMASCNAKTGGTFENMQIALAEDINAHPTKTIDETFIYDVADSIESSEKRAEDKPTSNVVMEHIKGGYSRVEATASSGFEKLNELKNRLTPSKKLFVLFKG